MKWMFVRANRVSVVVIRPRMAHQLPDPKTIAMFSWLLTLCGCGGTAPEPRRLDPNATMVREIQVVGFDSEAEPIIREMSDGSVWIQFEALPPFFTEDSDIAFDIDQFRADLENAARATVMQDDREVFVVMEPSHNSIDSIKTFLESYAKPNGG